MGGENHPPPFSMKSSLPSSEWVLVGSLLLVMISLVLIAKVNAHRACSILEQTGPTEVLVGVDGAVVKPGEYEVPVGTTIGSVLRKARPKANANLKIIPLNQPIEVATRLMVQELTEITVSVRGAVVEEKEIVLPVGSRICDLKSKVLCTAEADRRFFRRKKLLKDGQVLEVPKKTVEDNSSN